MSYEHSVGMRYVRWSLIYLSTKNAIRDGRLDPKWFFNRAIRLFPLFNCFMPFILRLQNFATKSIFVFFLVVALEATDMNRTRRTIVVLFCTRKYEELACKQFNVISQHAFAQSKPLYLPVTIIVSRVFSSEITFPFCTLFGLCGRAVAVQPTST